jgi:hypothetical protein
VGHVHFFVALAYLYTFTDIAGQTFAPFMINASIILSRTLSQRLIWNILGGFGPVVVYHLQSLEQNVNKQASGSHSSKLRMSIDES